MSIWFRRILAMLVDYLLIGFIFAVLQLPDFFFVMKFDVGPMPISIPSIGALIIIVYIGAKDLLFRNASIGKFLMGIVILTKEGRKPSIKTILMRGIIMQTYGYCKFVLTGFDKEYIQQWEMEKLGTCVVKKA